MTAGAAVGTVDGLGERVGRHMQLQDVSIRQLLLHAGGAMTAETVLVRRREALGSAANAGGVVAGSRQALRRRPQSRSYCRKRAGFCARCRSHPYLPHGTLAFNIIRGSFNPPGDRHDLVDCLPQAGRNFIDLSHSPRASRNRGPTTHPGQHGQADEGEENDIGEAEERRGNRHPDIFQYRERVRTASYLAARTASTASAPRPTKGKATM